MARKLQPFHGQPDRFQFESHAVLVLVEDHEQESRRFQELLYGLADFFGEETFNRTRTPIRGRAEVDLEPADLKPRIAVVRQDRNFAAPDSEFKRIEWNPVFWNQTHNHLLLRL